MGKINIFDFIGSENQNKLISVANLKGQLGYLQELDEIYQDLHHVFIVDSKNDMHYIVATLFLQAHNEYYIGMSQFLSSHLVKAFISLRIAIDAAFNAYYFTKHPEHVIEFMKRDSGLHKKVFWRIKAYIKEAIKEYPLAKDLIGTHELMSNISAHSSFSSILFKHHHIKKENNSELLALNYFDNIKPLELYLGYYFCLLMFFLRVFKLFYNCFYKKELKIIYPKREDRIERFEKNITNKYKKYRIKEWQGKNLDKK